MKDLIEALQIFSKYDLGDVINCSHDEMGVNIDPDIVSKEDKQRLDKLGFGASSDGYFYSFRFGNC